MKKRHFVIVTKETGNIYVDAASVDDNGEWVFFYNDFSNRDLCGRFDWNEIIGWYEEEVEDNE